MDRGIEPAESLRWTALQYVLGELSPAEHAAWETRLADDEACCAAVAEAALLVANLQPASRPSGAVVPATPVTVPARFSRTGLGAALSALAATAALAAVLLQSPQPSTGDAEQARLASLWHQDAARAAADDDADPLDDGAELAADDRIPDWLLAAVSLAERQRAAGQAPEQWEEN